MNSGMLKEKNVNYLMTTTQFCKPSFIESVYGPR